MTSPLVNQLVDEIQTAASEKSFVIKCLEKHLIENPNSANDLIIYLDKFKKQLIFEELKTEIGIGELITDLGQLKVGDEIVCVIHGVYDLKTVIPENMGDYRMLISDGIGYLKVTKVGQKGTTKQATNKATKLTITFDAKKQNKWKKLLERKYDGRWSNLDTYMDEITLTWIDNKWTFKFNSDNENYKFYRYINKEN